MQTKMKPTNGSNYCPVMSGCNRLCYWELRKCSALLARGSVLAQPISSRNRCDLSLQHKSYRNLCTFFSRLGLCVLYLPTDQYAEGEKVNKQWAKFAPKRLKDVIFLFNNFISQSLSLSRPVRPWTTWGSWRGRCSSRSKSSIGALTPPPFPAASTSSWSDSPMAPCSALLSTSALERWESSGRERKW